MADMMTFPDTWEEFEKSYGFDDSEEVYTNGSRLIPSFRVKQWLDHIAHLENERQATVSSDCIIRQAAKDVVDMELDAIDHVPEWVYDRLLTALDKVPSAQPKVNGVGDLISRHGVIKAVDKFIPADPMKSDYTQGISVGLALATRCIEEFSQETDESSQGLVKDTISRQAAIETIDRYYKDKMYITRSRTILSAICRDMKSTMDSLPSAQPEQIIRCTNCRFFKRNIPCTGGHYNGCEMWLDDGNEIRVMTDDYCSKALPKEGEEDEAE